MSLIEDIKQHAQDEYPRESCGLVVNIDGVDTYVRCRNLAENPGEQFVMQGEDYADAADRGNVVALVHSHPNASAQPSDADRVMCEASEMTWHIISIGKTDQFEFSDLKTIVPTGWEAPLRGRQFAHGILDCYTLVQDFYKRELHIQLGAYDRQDEWWNKGGDLYSMDRLTAEGFYEVSRDNLQRGDMIIMQIRSPVPNHAGVYLGDGTMLHHMHGRLSDVVPYGGMWTESTRRIVRHRGAK